MKLLGSGVDAAVVSENDIFGRDKFALGLLHLFSSSKDPLAICLDEKWGAGKTVFAKRFVKRAEAAGHSAVYFDAFKRDYDPDVFIGLTSELLAKFPADPVQERTIKEKAVAVGRVLGRIGLKIGVRALTGGIARSTDFDEAKGETVSGNEIDAAGIVDAELDKLIDERLSGAKIADAAFDGFRKALQELGQSGGENVKPLIFIVDELDRCRPDYALDVLETIKHFFSVPGVHFLLVCDYAQILSSVSARYGLTAESGVYLEKFFDARVSFPTQNEDDLKISIGLFIENSIQGMPEDGKGGEQWRGMVEFLTNISIRKRYSLRRIERILTQFALCMAFTNSNQLRLGVVVYVLCDLKVTNVELFKKAKNGSLTYNDLEDFYEFSKSKSEWFTDWLRLFYDKSIKVEESHWQELIRSLRTYYFRDHHAVAVYLVNDVVDRISA